jgi:hypothetical protein
MEKRVRAYAALALLATAASTACDDITDTAIPTALEAVSPVEVTGVVGSRVSSPPTVRVRDERGTPVPGLRVLFQTEGLSGSVARSSARTNREGVATAGEWVLGTLAGDQKVYASVEHGIPPVLFTARAEPGPAAQLVRIGGDNQAGVFGTTLSTRLRVQVMDEFDNSIAGAPVAFIVIAGNGTIDRDDAVSDASGVATSAAWTLGPSPGVQQVRAQAGAVNTVFTAVACEAVILSGCGGYTLESVVIGNINWTTHPPSTLRLFADGRFVVTLGPLSGSGTYTESGPGIAFRYEDNFLKRLEDEFSFFPQQYSDGLEWAAVQGDRIRIVRCWTEDCYQSTWTYRNVPP